MQKRNVLFQLVWFISLGLICLLSGFWISEALRAEEPVSFKEVKGILKDYACFECHKPPKPSKDVDLSTHEAMMDYVIPGDPEGSRLIQVLVSRKMPVPGSGPPLMEEDIELLKEWIQAGAKKE